MKRCHGETPRRDAMKRHLEKMPRSRRNPNSFLSLVTSIVTLYIRVDVNSFFLVLLMNCFPLLAILSPWFDLLLPLSSIFSEFYLPLLFPLDCFRSQDFKVRFNKEAIRIIFYPRHHPIYKRYSSSSTLLCLGLIRSKIISPS